MSRQKYGFQSVVFPHAGHHIVDHVSLAAARTAKEAARGGEIDWSTFRMEVGQGVVPDPFENGVIGLRVEVEVEQP